MEKDITPLADLRPLDLSMRKKKNGASIEKPINEKPESLIFPTWKKACVRRSPKLILAQSSLTHNDHQNADDHKTARRKASVPKTEAIRSETLLTRPDNDDSPNNNFHIHSIDSNEVPRSIASEIYTRAMANETISSEGNSDIDDNSSVTSELSLFASDCDIFSLPKRENVIDEDWNTGSDSKKYRIPKIKKSPEVTPPPPVDQVQSDDRSLERKVKEIMARYKRDSPKLLSPVQDLEPSLKRLRHENNCKRPKKDQFRDALTLRPPDRNEKSTESKSNDRESQPNRKLIAPTEPTGMDETCNLSKRYTSDMTAPTELDQSKMFPKENVVDEDTTKDTTEEHGLRSGYKSNFDFKNLPVLVINAGDINSVRIISVAPTVMETPAQLVPVPPAAVESVPCLQQMNNSASLMYEQPVPHHRPLSTHAVPIPQPMSNQQIAQPIDSVQNHANIVSLANQRGQDSVQNHANIVSLANQRGQDSVRCNEKPRKITEILKLFGQPCINFLNEKACKSLPCPYKHILPSPDDAFAAMVNYPEANILFTYSEFIVKNRKAFMQYFPKFCHLFGTRKMETVFEQLIRDCEAYKKYDYLQCVFDGLILCGKAITDAFFIMMDVCVVCDESREILRKIGTQITLNEGK